MDTFYKNIILVLLLILGCSAALKAQEHQLDETIEKTFPISESGRFYLSNVYGDVIINGWDKNSVVVEASIKVSHKKSDMAKDLMDRIETEFQATKDFVNVTSKISDAKKSLISRLFNDVNPIDLDKSNVEINYTVYLPKKNTITLENKFGDIIISDFDGTVNTTLSHGNLWINQDLAKANLTLSFSKLKAQAIQEASIQSNNCSLTIESIDNFKLRSRGSDIGVASVNALDIMSKNDEISIAALTNVSGELKYTTLLVDELKADLNMQLQLTDLSISKITGEKPTIKMYQKSSTIKLNVTHTSLSLNAVLEKGILKIPNTFTNIDTEVIDKKENKRIISASYGTSAIKGELNITGVKGKILITD